MKLNENSSILYAKELTIAAIEHNMITTSVDPIETAKNVTDFFNHIADTLNGKNNKAN